MLSLSHQPPRRAMQPHWWSVAATAVVIIAIEAVVALALLGTRPWPVNPQMHLHDTSGGLPPALGGLGAMPLPPSL
jgi:hypothetical protein